MKKQELTITEVLGFYLPYGITVLTPIGVSQLERVKVGHRYDGYKPILKNVNDISMLEIMACGYHTEGEFFTRLKEGRLYFNAVRRLLELHYDIFGLIDADIALGINSQPIKDEE